MKLYAVMEKLRVAGSTQFELEQWIETSPFERHVGVSIEQAGEGKSRLTVPFKVKLANGGGVMHGGALATLADTAVAMAIKSLLPPGTQFATTDMQMKFLAPVKEGVVEALAKVSSGDGRVFHGTCELRGAANVLYATFSSTFKVITR